MKPVSFIVILLGGMLFGFGLSVSTMIQPEVVLSFLRLQDLGLLLVLGGAAFVTMIAYQLLPRILKHPLLEAGEFGTKKVPLTRRTVIGSAIFGIGWGMCGVCPGPAIAGLGAGLWLLVLTVAGILAGAYLQGRTTKV